MKSVPLIITHEPELGATLKMFHCPNCGTEWIADYEDYTILHVDSLGFVKIEANCPTCSCPSTPVYPYRAAALVEEYRKAANKLDKGEK